MIVSPKLLDPIASPAVGQEFHVMQFQGFAVEQYFSQTFHPPAQGAQVTAVVDGAFDAEGEDDGSFDGDRVVDGTFDVDGDKLAAIDGTADADGKADGTSDGD